MNRILYNPRITAKYFMELEHLLILNYLNDNKEASYSTLLSHIENVTGEDADDDYVQLIKWGMITDDINCCKLTPKGKAFFAEDTILSPEEYEITRQILLAWNEIPETTNHKLKLQSEPQTKTVFRTCLIILSLLQGKLHTLISDATYKDEPVGEFEAMVLEDIIDTIKDYGLKFQKDYYPESKKNLPKVILEFFMNHQYFRSEFFSVYFDGVLRKKTGTASKLAELGITPKTLKKVYDVMLTPSDRNSESAKYKMMKHLLLVHEQWKVLVVELDQYYLWNKKYRDLTSCFNYFILDYVTWMENNIGCGKPLMFMQLKEDHEIYAHFRAYYSDHYQIDLKVSRSKTEYLRGKTKKYLEGKK